MELGGYVVIVCVVVVGLLLKIADLQGLLKELRKELINQRIETFGFPSSSAKEYVIDCDAEAFSIPGCVVIFHQKNGKLKWTGIGRFYATKEPIKGVKLREQLYSEEFGQEVLNGNYLDFLKDNQYLIPNDWPLVIPFFGTVYRKLENGRCFVRCLTRRDGIYATQNQYLDAEFDCRMKVILK